MSILTRAPADTPMGLIVGHAHLERQANMTYYQFSRWAWKAGYPGACAFFLAESDDELGHFKQFVQFIQESLGVDMTTGGELVEIVDPSTLADALNSYLEHEVAVWQSMDRVDKAWSGNGLVSTFIDQMRIGQVESIAKGRKLLNMVKAAGNDTAALLIVDGQLAGD